jgi:DNA polymerase-3 subunit gamma/tau
MSLPSLFPNDGSADAPPATDVVAESPAAAVGMSGQTQSLYRKYRPQSFDAHEMVGQDHVVQTLRNAILLDRVAHAYLFCGPRGTGKTTTARLLAKAVNCLDPDPLQRPCNACDNCRAITSGSTTDVIEIDAASNRGIDDIRDLRERVKYAPTQLRTKFYIIDEAHQITGAAANAFLKTLEEPPPHTKFVLATTDPEELLPTIVSRCQRFDFRRIGLDAMVERLRTVATAENLEVDDEALTVIARHATGSLRDALGLLDQLAVYREGEPTSDVQTIDAAAVRAVLGVSRNDRVEALVTALADQDAQRALETVNAAVEAGEDPRQLNRQLVAYLRVLLHERAGGSPDADDAARTLAKRFELLEIAQLARRFSEIDYRIRHSSYSQLPLEVALVEAILHKNNQPSAPRASAEPVRPAPDVEAVTPPPDDLASRPPTTALRDRLRREPTRPAVPSQPDAPPAQAETPAPTPKPVAPPATPPVPPPAQQPAPAPATNGGALTIDTIVDLWSQIRRDTKAVNRRIEALLLSFDPVAVQQDVVTLATPYEFHRNRLSSDEDRGVVEDVISRLANQRVRVSCVLRDEVVSNADAPAATPAPQRPATTSAPPPTAVQTSANGHSAVAPEPDPAAIDNQRLDAAKNIFDADEV